MFRTIGFAPVAVTRRWLTRLVVRPKGVPPFDVCTARSVTVPVVQAAICVLLNAPRTMTDRRLPDSLTKLDGVEGNAVCVEITLTKISLALAEPATTFPILELARMADEPRAQPLPVDRAPTGDARERRLDRRNRGAAIELVHALVGRKDGNAQFGKGREHGRLAGGDRTGEAEFQGQSVASTLARSSAVT